MKTLIVEDDFTSRLILQSYLRDFGPSHIAVNGSEAVAAVQMALDAGEPYDLICMDIMMPGMNGQQALKEIRGLEEARGILSTHGSKIVMTTVLGDMKSICDAYSSLCDAYLVKPIGQQKLLQELRKLGLIN
jgi:two-component system chemotaxis response regulator CheY